MHSARLSPSERFALPLISQRSRHCDAPARPRKTFAGSSRDRDRDRPGAVDALSDSQGPALRRAVQNRADLEAFRQCGDERQRRLLRERLLRNNLPLVYAITGRMAAAVRLPSEDLQQIGSLGLLRAIEAFQPSRGRSLSSFAVPYIRGAIQHELRDRYSLVRIPRELWELRRRASALQDSRRRQGLASLAPQALAAALGCAPERLLEALQLGAVMEMRSLDAPLAEEGGADTGACTLLDRVADPASLGGLQPLEAARPEPPDSGRCSAVDSPHGCAPDGGDHRGAEAWDSDRPDGPHPAAGRAEQRWLRRHLASLDPLQRELLLGHVCCGCSWAELGRELGLHPRQAQRLTTAVLLRLQQEGQNWRRAWN